MAASISILTRTCSFVFLFAAWMAQAASSPGVFNVLDFGAVADGETDNAKAFLSAWNKACSCEGTGEVLIPSGTFMTKAVKFEGPCSGNTAFQLQGIVIAPARIKSDHWLFFSHINGFSIYGGGKIDGHGTEAWYNHNHSKGGKRAINLGLNYVTDATISGISSVDSKYFHINVYGCKNVTFEYIQILAPVDSPNTDGIHIGHSSGIKISRSMIGTGDDCVSIGDGSQDIFISDIYCGPGHGISIGSLGKYENEEPVEGVTVKRCTITGTQNGVRIKTWPDAYSNVASNLVFDDILMNNVENPIIIDQQYCPHYDCNHDKPSSVMIKDVIFRNIKGTSATKLGVKLLCSESVPCQDVQISDIDLRYTGNDGPITSTCSNVQAFLSGEIAPPTCV